MMVTVNPCFHWIGFHITSTLLQEGIEVIGIDPIQDSKSDLLYMYVGRNSNFQHFFQRNDKENHIQQMNDEWEIDLVDGGLLLRQGEEEKEWIELPLLYGEWMNINQTGVTEKKDMLKWVIEHEPVYVGHFMKAFLRRFLTNDRFTLEKRSEDEAVIRDRVEALWRCEQLLNNR